MYRFSNINQYTLSELACSISKKSQYGKPVIIGDVHEILFFKNQHRIKSASSCKHIIYTVRCKLPEIVPNRPFIQVFQIGSFCCIRYPRNTK